MTWGLLIAVNGLLGLVFAIGTRRWRGLWAVLVGGGLLSLLPYMMYWGLARISGHYAEARGEFAAWSWLFILPAVFSGCLILLLFRLQLFLKTRRLK